MFQTNDNAASLRVKQMRTGSLCCVMIGIWLGVWPAAAHADYLASARAALKKGDLKSAQIDLRNAVRNDPLNAEAHYWLGRVAFELGDPVASEREAIAARSRGYDPREAAALLSQALLAQGKFEPLLETLKPSGKDPLLDASILVSRGYALIGLNRSEEAQKLFAEAERVAPNAAEPLLADARLAVARADLPTAQAKIDRAVAAQPKSTEVLLAKAQLLRLRHNAPAGIAVLDALIADQPSVTQARLDRASLELASGGNDAARRDIDTVLRSTPGNVQAIYLRAVTETGSRNFKAADADLERISAYVGQIDRGYYLQAIVKQQLGQTEQAEDAARKYLGRSPNDLPAYKVLAQIEFARQRPDQVIDTLDKVAETGKADAEAYDLLGRAYAATGQGLEAVEAFQKAEALAPDNVGVRTRLASVRMGMGDPDAALSDLEHALTLAPKMPAAAEALFFAALATGDPVKATDALTRIHAAQGDSEIFANLQGVFELAQINLEAARATFSDVVQKHPDFTPAKINLARVMLMLGDKNAAKTILGDILAKQPIAEPALTMLVSIDTQDNRQTEALGLLERAHRADPTLLGLTVSLGDLYIRSGTPRKALDLASAEQGPNAGSTQIQSLRAAAYLALGQKNEARATYTELLKQDPNVADARRELVALQIQAGDFEAARNAINTGIAANPRNYRLYQDLVTVDLRSSGLDAALATADRLRSQARDFPAIRALKGDLYRAAQRPADAVTAYAEAYDTAPSTMLVVRTAGAMVQAARTDDAGKLMREWLAKHPDDMAATEEMAEIAIATRNLDEAATYLNLLLKQKPHDVVALNNLAWVYQQRGDNPRAQLLARQAYVLAPGPQTADTLGWIFTTSGNPGNGVALLRQASAETAADPRILFHYAVALRDTGNRDEAKKQLATVIAAKGDFKEKNEAQKLLDDLAKGS